MPVGREQVARWRSALILVVARLCHPSSELYIAEQWYPKSALPELLGVPANRVDDNRLYRTLDQLLPHKEKLEIHLKNQMGEWKTLGQMCQQAGLGNEPRRVLEELGDLRIMDVVLPTRTGIDLRKRCLSKPTDLQQILLERLKLRLPKINQAQM